MLTLLCVSGEIREIFASNLNDEINRTLKDIGMIEIKQGRRGRTKVVELEDTVPTRVSFIRETLVDILKNAPGQELSTVVLAVTLIMFRTDKNVVAKV